MRDLYMAQLNGINNDVIDMGLVLGNATILFVGSVRCV